MTYSTPHSCPPTQGSSAQQAQSPLGAEFRARLANALGPALGALVLDFADLITFGPFGIYGGLFIGAAVGWWMSGSYGFGRAGRIAVALSAGIYCMLPATHFLPLASILSATGRFLEDPPEATS